MTIRRHDLNKGIIAALVGWFVGYYPQTTCSEDRGALRVGLAPYQDMAMLINYKNLSLDKKFNMDIELLTLGWEDLLLAVASAGRTVDVSFGGLIEYLTKAEAINAGAQDPIKFIYPLYAFKGGALISFVKDVPNLTSRLDRAAVERFLGFRLGFPKFSSIHMLIAELVSRVGIPAREIKFTDVPFDDALLAAEGGSLDVVGAGLTQRAEALKRGGRVVASMESAGFADFGGFVVRGSTLERRRGDLENLIRIWFECVKYVLANLEENSKYTIAYLDAKSATKYSVGEFREALAAEFFPTSIAEARQEFLADSGSFPIRPIASSIAKFLTAEGILKGRSPPLELIDMEPHEIRK